MTHALLHRDETTQLESWQLDEARLAHSKLEIGNYIEQCGYAVPRRFDTLEDSLDHVRQGGSIIIRSESPQDYDGPSGLLPSFIVSPEKIAKGQYLHTFFPDIPDATSHIFENEDDILPYRGISASGPGVVDLEEIIIGQVLEKDPQVTLEVLSKLSTLEPKVKRYVEVTGDTSFLECNETWFSFWEYVPGTNITIVADDVIEDQYHIVGYDELRSRRFGAIVQADGMMNRYTSGAQEVFDKPALIGGVLNMYNSVRSLPAFAPNDCPIMELQVDSQGSPWFLQYHKGREFSSSDVQLDPRNYPGSEGWIQLNTVRGAIGELATLQTAMVYPTNYGTSQFSPLPSTEQASAAYSQDHGLQEALAQRRTAYIRHADFGSVYGGMSDGHELRSQWFRPKTAVAYGAVDRSAIFPEAVTEALGNITDQGRYMAHVIMDLATDGRRGYMRLNPDAEQPVVSSL